MPSTDTQIVKGGYNKDQCKIYGLSEWTRFNISVADDSKQQSSYK